MKYPTSYRYTKDHEWIDANGGSATIGLTEYAQCQLGDVVFVELPGLGVHLEAGKPFGIVESVKTASDIYAPVSGEVVEVNGDLKDAPEILNSDPHGGGWLVKVRFRHPAEIESLMDAAAYRAYVALPCKEASE